MTPADVGNVSYTSSDDGVVTVDADGNVKAVGAGEATITVSYAGNDKYNPVNTTVAVTVSKVDADIEVSADPITVGEDAVIVVSGLENATGNVTATVDGEKYYAPIVDGVATITVSGLAENATAVVSYPGNNKYNNFTDSVDITVNPKAKENATVDISSNTPREGENVTVSVTLPEDATGNVTAVVGGKEYSAPVKDGKATLNIPGLAAGNYTIPVSYSGDDKYNPAEDNVTVTVNPKGKADSNINVSAENIGEREVANVIVSLPGDATGNVTVILNGESKVININDTTVRGLNGVLSMLVTYSDLVADNYTVIVIYSGDDKYDSSNATTTFEVAKAPKENVTMDISVDAVSEGENATVTVTLPEDASGNVTVGDVTVPVVNGTASVSVSGLAVGNTTLSVVYSGDDKYAPAEDNVTVTVNPKDEPVIPKEDLNVSVSADEITVGDDAVILVSGLGNATGNVTATVNGKDYTAPIVDGVASIAVSGLAENATAVVSYPGDDKYNNFTESVDIVVNPKDGPVIPKENVTMDISVDAVSEDENATVTVTLPEDASGNVTVGDVTVPVVNGTASVSVSGLAVGNTTLSVVYSGDDKYAPAEDNVTVTVNPKDEPVIPKEDLNVSVSADEITVGDDAVILVSGLGNATGNVTATVNGKDYTAPIVDGVASIAVSGLAENATAVVSYLGDDKYNNFTESVDIVVNPKVIPKENTHLDIITNTPIEGENAIIFITLPKDATGNVTAKIGDKTYIIPLKDGKATLTIPKLDAGNYSIPVTYSGDVKYNSLTKYVNLTVEKDKANIISAPNVVKYYKGSERFVVTVTDCEGNPVANKSVNMRINGVNYARTTNSNGAASIALGLNSGVYNVDVIVDNKIINATVTILSTVNGSDIVKVYRNGTQYYATFLDSDGNYLKEGTTVKFNINGVIYERKVSGDKGLAKLNINLEQGEYVITAMNPETHENAANNISVISRLVENNDLTKYYRNASQYAVKVLGDDGRAVGAGAEVTFNINGVLYTRQTNASGIAKLNINLHPGDYIITAEYYGCKVSNDIKVISVLSASDLSMKYRDGSIFTASLVDGQGNPYRGQMIDFNVNGMLYQRKTNDNGQARININLMVGQYIITSSYDGTSIANTITISS